jgi:hypothetical protein
MFAAGLLLSLLFFAVTRAEVQARGRAENTAAGWSVEATTRKTLTEREGPERPCAKARAISRVDRERKRHCLHARL